MNAVYCQLQTTDIPEAKLPAHKWQVGGSESFYQRLETKSGFTESLLSLIDGRMDDAELGDKGRSEKEIRQ